MKRILVLFFFTLVASQLTACRLVKKKHRPRQTESQTAATDTEKKPGTVVVSFISFGAGIDFKTLPDFEQFIKDYNTRSSCGFQYQVKNWGREGERDYCFAGNGKPCFNDFILSLKNRYKGNDRILVKENETCRP